MKKSKRELGKLTLEDNLDNCFSTSDKEKEINRFYPYNIEDIATRLTVQNILSFAMSKPHIR